MTDELVLYIGAPAAVVIAIATAAGYYFKKRASVKSRQARKTGG